MNPSQQTNDHDKLAELLPWYVNGTLDQAERQRVERHIDECAECREDADLLADVGSAVCNGSPAPLVPPPDEERLLAALEQSEKRRSRRAWPWIAAAATVAAVAIAIAWQPGSRPESAPMLFETVTSPAVDQSINYVLEIQFVPGASARSHGAFFDSIGAGELAVPLGEDTYRVALGLGPVSLAKLEQYADSIESHPEIAKARFVAVQLPVE